MIDFLIAGKAVELFAKGITLAISLITAITRLKNIR